MLLLLQRIGFRIGLTVNLDAAGRHFGGLSLGRRGFDLAFDRHAAARAGVLDLGFVVGQLRRGDDLQVRQATAVVDLQEAEARLGVAPRADPALHAHLPADGRGLACLLNRDLFHGHKALRAS